MAITMIDRRNTSGRCVVSSLLAVLSRHCARRIAIREAIDLGEELVHALHRNLTRLVLMHRCNSLEDDMNSVRIPRKDLSKCTVGKSLPRPAFRPNIREPRRSKYSFANLAFIIPTPSSRTRVMELSGYAATAGVLLRQMLFPTR